MFYFFIQINKNSIKKYEILIEESMITNVVSSSTFLLALEQFTITI